VINPSRGGIGVGGIEEFLVFHPGGSRASRSGIRGSDSSFVVPAFDDCFECGWIT
jgi:hypothetical protein